MDRRRTKFLLLGIGVVATMVAMLALSVSQPEGLVYYLKVTEFLDSGAEPGDDYRVNGKVAMGSIERLQFGEDVRFVLTDGERTLPVAYQGIIPDTFVDRADVVVEGHLEEDGTFSAQMLLAKCPSKYEAADGADGAESYATPDEAPAAE